MVFTGGDAAETTQRRLTAFFSLATMNKVDGEEEEKEDNGGEDEGDTEDGEEDGVNFFPSTSRNGWSGTTSSLLTRFLIALSSS